MTETILGKLDKVVPSIYMKEVGLHCSQPPCGDRDALVSYLWSIMSSTFKHSLNNMIGIDGLRDILMFSPCCLGQKHKILWAHWALSF